MPPPLLPAWRARSWDGHRLAPLIHPILQNMRGATSRQVARGMVNTFGVAVSTWLAGSAPAPLQRQISSLTCLRGWAPAALSAGAAVGRPARPAATACVPRALASGAGSKVKTAYECSECGEQQLQWSGQCKSCGAWNT